jgi:integrase/recombinase XerC
MTSTALVQVAAPVSAIVTTVDRSGLLEAFLAGRNERTLAAYRADLESFPAFMKAATVSAAADRLLAGTHSETNGAALAYKAHMKDASLQAATINRRLAALRSLVKPAKTLGVVAWTLSVENMKGQSYRDTRGPGRESFKAMVAGAGAQRGPKRKSRAPPFCNTSPARCLRRWNGHPTILSSGGYSVTPCMK